MPETMHIDHNITVLREKISSLSMLEIRTMKPSPVKRTMKMRQSITSPPDQGETLNEKFLEQLSSRETGESLTVHIRDSTQRSSGLITVERIQSNESEARIKKNYDLRDQKERMRRIVIWE